jgi:hypothetical protein
MTPSDRDREMAERISGRRVATSHTAEDIAAALGTARAEGFAEGIEKAAQCVEDRGHEAAGWGFLQEYIRALLPAREP